MTREEVMDALTQRVVKASRKYDAAYRNRYHTETAERRGAMDALSDFHKWLSEHWRA